MRKKQRVKTKYGVGTIVALEGPYGAFSTPWYRYGVLHDTIPPSFSNIKDSIMYFVESELQDAKEADNGR